ncbi:restriction endonuclease subunit S [Methanospirillum lacunae]|uniref:Type I restriction modification DNA specificity domain-containing protein n=1 Tax=Methanospirillum lacunae TaxID=668570 RepID=A0A2V2N1N6_9EURY|nr:restriction endonuclease subunit S [Methanospirillum lacunae]PWR73679.1 hypothetical protein DK846_00460 [Methanospirillum lacunae]
MTDKIKIDTIRGGNLLRELRADDVGIIEDSSRMNGELPKGWIVTTIGDILDISVEKTNPPFTNIYTYIGLEHIERNSGKIIDIGRPEEIKSTKTVFHSGDLLYGKLRPNLNKVWVADRNGICSTDILVFVKNSNISNKFFLYRLLSYDYVSYASHITSGVELPRIDQKKINQFSIFLPPLNEQHRIVAKIEELFTQLDAGIASLQAAQVKLNQYRKAVLKHAFEGKLTEAWREAYKDEIEPVSVLLERIREERRKDKKYKELPPVDAEGLPELPEGWVWTTIETLHPAQRTCAYGVLQPGDEVEGGIPLVRVGDIGEGGFYNTNLKKIDPKISEKYKRTILQGGEVLVSLVGAIGRTAVVPDCLKGANTARAVGVIPLSEHINSHYLEMWIRHPTNNAELESKAHEVARKTLNLEDVRVFKVALAPKKEQDKIVSEIRQKISIIDSIDKIVFQSILQSDLIRQSILKKAFEGRLVPQDPSDEPASVLLEKIRQEKITREPKKRGRKNKGT